MDRPPRPASPTPGPLPADDARIFEHLRPDLTHLARRILGPGGGAALAVQATLADWGRADRAAIRRPVTWLTTICAAHCIALRSGGECRRPTDADSTERLAATLTAAARLMARG